MTNIDLSGDGQVLAPLAETEAQDHVADRQRLFEIQDLRVSFKSESGPVQAVRGVDVVVHEGELLGIVGESGSGKSVTFLAAMGLLPKSATVDGLRAHPRPGAARPEAQGDPALAAASASR